MKNFTNIFSNIRLSLFQIIILGIILRLLAAIFFTHTFDTFNILVLIKSVFDTGTLFYGFYAIGDVQLYGKLYYQIASLWMYFLQTIHLIDSRYIFDVKPFQNGGVNYLQGFSALSPELYQVIALKLVQFFYDGLLLFFLLKTAKLLKLPHIKALGLFWAINPLFIYVGYIIFQADLAMIAFFMGGTYFSLKALSDSPKGVSKEHILALVFFTIGAVIKQVPILALPFVLLVFSRSIKQFLFYCAVVAASYILVYQPWSIDAVIIKKHFLTSPESTALFNSGINGFNLFFTLYLMLLGYFITVIHKVRQKPILLLQFIVLIIAVVFIAEDTKYIFFQFNIWIMPFLALLTLYDKNYALFLIIALIGFYKRLFFDNAILSGSYSTAFGEPLSQQLEYSYFINKIINLEIIDKLFGSVLSLGYALLALYTLGQITSKFTLSFIKRLTSFLKNNLYKTSIALFLIFVLIGLGEILLMSSSVKLTNYIYSESSSRTLTKKAVTFDVNNKKRHTISAISVKLETEGKLLDDHTIVKAMDPKTQKVLAESRIYDLQLSDEADEMTFFLNRPINQEFIRFQIYKDKGINTIKIYEASEAPIRKTQFPRYEYFYSQEGPQISFLKEFPIVNLRGQYGLSDGWNSFVYQISKKPKFFIAYFSVIVILILLLFIPLSKILKKIQL